MKIQPSICVLLLFVVPSLLGYDCPGKVPFFPCMVDKCPGETRWSECVYPLFIHAKGAGCKNIYEAIDYERCTGHTFFDDINPIKKGAYNCCE